MLICAPPPFFLWLKQGPGSSCTVIHTNAEWYENKDPLTFDI